MASSKVTVDEVQAVIHRLWRVMKDKTPGVLQNLYTYDATLFNEFAQRMEPGRVSAARREREYFTQPKTSFHGEITSPIDVMIVADNVAVASYTFRWRATGMIDRLSDKEFDKTVRNGRATEVLLRDEDGNLRILHEHQSDIWRDSIQEQ